MSRKEKTVEKEVDTSTNTHRKAAAPDHEACMEKRSRSQDEWTSILGVSLAGDFDAGLKHV